MTSNQTIDGVLREQLERFLVDMGTTDGRRRARKELRALLDAPAAECRCRRYGKDNPHWPCPVHPTQAAQPLGGIESLRAALRTEVEAGDSWKREALELRVQLSEANDLLRKMADIDLASTDLDHEHWQYLLGEVSLQLATSEQPKAPPPEALSFEFQHPVSKERRTITVTKAEVAEGMEDGLYEKLVAQVCQCEPVGETNVVDCACDEYVHDFDLAAKVAV